MSTKPQIKLFVLMRPDCDQALILRQGPSKVFCSLGWNLATDKVIVGQWCKHKIYVERCDISSNGKYFCYFALNGNWSSETKGAWTAVSYAPYLKALKLWPQGDTWGGGGSFVRDRKPVSHKFADVFRELDVFDGELLIPIFGADERLVRDGWTLVRKRGKRGARKPLTNTLSLQQTGIGGTPRFGLVDGDLLSPRPTWTWADVDHQRKRLLWAEDGVLYQARIEEGRLGESAPIFDARDMTFEPIAAPYQDPTIIVGA
jgi:hypothetical protein